MFYHTISSDGGSQTRFMLGMESWNRIEGDDVFSGVFGFDFYGHLVAIPNGELQWYGGGDGCGQNTEEQAVFKDNHVIS